MYKRQGSRISDTDNYIFVNHNARDMLQGFSDMLTEEDVYKRQILQTMREQGEKIQTEPEKKAPSGRDAER